MNANARKLMGYLLTASEEEFKQNMPKSKKPKPAKLKRQPDLTGEQLDLHYKNQYGGVKKDGIQPVKSPNVKNTLVRRPKR